MDSHGQLSPSTNPVAPKRRTAIHVRAAASLNDGGPCRGSWDGDQLQSELQRSLRRWRLAKPMLRVGSRNALGRHKRVCGVVPVPLEDATAHGGGAGWELMATTSATRASTKLTSWEVGGADLAQRPPERAPEGEARLWSRSAGDWGRYSARRRG